MTRLTVCPACDVPPPRGNTLTPSSRAIALARSASAIVRGTTTAERHLLIVRGISRVAPAVEAVEQHIADPLGFSADARVQGPPLLPSFCFPAVLSLACHYSAHDAISAMSAYSIEENAIIILSIPTYFGILPMH